MQHGTSTTTASFTTAYQDWQKEVNGLADEDDLPDDKTMADDLERLIWALWVPRLHTKEIRIRDTGPITECQFSATGGGRGRLREGVQTCR